jgi:hypothetical protein
MKSLRYAVACSLAGLLAAGCGGVVDPSKNQVENFSGTLEVGGAVTHFFSVSKNGEMSARLTAITPGSASLLGTALGEQVSGTCSVFGVNNFTGLNRDVFAGPINKGSYCMQVFDPGSLTAAQNYTLQISHP